MRYHCAIVLALLAPGCASRSQTMPPQVTPHTEHAPAGRHVAPESGRRRQVTQHEYGVVTELMRTAERVRGLRFRQPVAVHVEDAEAIQAYAREELKRDELGITRTVYVALGLLPVELDIEALLVRLMGEQVLGYYDAREKRLVVRDDVMRGFAESQEFRGAEEVLLHELVHALQDQHFDLGQTLDRERNTDEENAFRALVEGDATLAMLGLAMERERMPLSEITGDPRRVEFLRQIAEESASDSPELSRAPAIIRVTLLSAYADGVVFAAHLHRRGGWGLVDRAHRSPPATTEGVLHPERRNQSPTAIGTLGAEAGLIADGFQPVKSDTLGELELGVYFAQGVRTEQARRAADGWNGDRLDIYKAPDGRLAALWRTAWDTPRDAREAAEAADAVVRMGPLEARRGCAVVHRGSQVAILRGWDEDRVDTIAAQALTTPVAWSTGSATAATTR